MYMFIFCWIASSCYYVLTCSLASSFFLSVLRISFVPSYLVVLVLSSFSLCSVASLALFHAFNKHIHKYAYVYI